MDNLHQIQKDIGDLKIDIATIKTEVGEMKRSVSETMVKISESLILLAKITERINMNTEEHKNIHRRIDDLEISVREVVISHALLKRSHEECQQQKANEYQLEYQEEQNSVVKRVKGAVAEWSVIGFVALLLYTLYNNVGPFLKMLKG